VLEVETNRACCEELLTNQKKILHPNASASTHSIITVAIITASLTATATKA